MRRCSASCSTASTVRRASFGTTREELVLSLAPGSGVEPIPWDDATIERAVRAGLLGVDRRRRATRVAQRVRGPGAASGRRARPVQWLIDGGQGLAGLFD